MEPILRATHLKKAFFFPEKVEILKDISLEVYPGESVAIMGASGEGKTTLLHILGSLEEKDAGSLHIAGLKPCAATRLHHIGFIFQNYNLLEDLTVIENILLPARIARKEVQKNSETYQKAIELLETVHLLPRKNFPINLLSEGEKQRCSLARALINDPSILLADEPSGNLDHTNSQEIHSLLVSLASLHNKGLIVATHDKDLANLCQKKFLLKEGSLFPLNE